MANKEVNIDSIIQNLLAKGSNQPKLTETEIVSLCTQSKEIFLKEPTLLQLKAPIKVVGRFYPSFTSFLNERR
jgi:serine/threonine-protein phosphatase PP1 catalytic subunit